MSVLIGDRDCLPVDVYNKMSESPGGGLLSKWKDVARNLKISEDVIDQISLDQGIRNLRSGEIYIELFKAYRSEKKHEATLEKLIAALKSIGMNDIAGFLRSLHQKILSERNAAQHNPHI